MILAMCDPATANFNITGETIVMNPYGHIPARLYGILPFVRILLAAYSILAVIWMIRCYRYSKELMSVHFVISIVLVVFLIDTFEVSKYYFIQYQGFLCHICYNCFSLY